MVFGINRQRVAVINIAKSNLSYRYLLTVVHMFSKYTWVEPVKSKTGKEVMAGFNKILKRSQAPNPKIYRWTMAKTFQALMKRENIHHFSISGDTKASVLD